MSSEDSQDYYDLKEEDMEHCPEFYGTENGFYLDVHTAMEALQYYMDLEGKTDLSAEYWSGAGSVTKDSEKRDHHISVKEGRILYKKDGRRGKSEL